jgi:signal transduction histidine kinase
MNEEKDAHLKKIVLLPIIIAVLLAGISVCSVFLLINFNKQEAEERTAVMGELAVQTATVIDTNIDYSQDETLYCETMITEAQLDSAEDLYTVLAESNTKTKTSLFMVAFSSDNKYYYADNDSQGTGNLSDGFEIASITDHQPVVSDLTNGTPCVLSIQKLDTPITVGNEIEITHVAAALDLSSIETVFGSQEFYSRCAIYLTDADGTSLYHNPSVSYDGTKVDNVINVLAQRSFITGTVDELKTSMQAQKTITLEFERDDGNWYLSATPADQGEMTVFVFAPEEAITTSRSGIVTEMVVLMVAFALCILALVLVLAAVQYRIRFNRNMRGGNIPTNQNEYRTVPTRTYGDENTMLPPDIEASGRYYSQATQGMQNPVNGIVGMTNNALQNRVDVAGLEDCLYKINGTSNRLLTLVNDMIDMSKLDNGSLVLEKNNFNMRSLIENCASMVSGKFLLRNIPFEYEFSPLTHTQLLGDEMRLRQVLLNLLSYAEGYASEGDKVRFTVNELQPLAGRAQYQFVVEVSARLSDQSCAHLFEPFWKDDEEVDNMLEGKGLGLTVAKRIVTLMGGTIDVQNTAENGSRFTVNLAFGYDERGEEPYPIDVMPSESSADKPS